MNNKIVISSSNSSKLSTISLDTIRRLIQSNVVDIQSFDKIILPASMTEIYIYLKNQIQLKKKGKINQLAVQNVIQQILISQKTSHQNTENDHINSSYDLLADQVIEAISQLQQNIIERFQLDRQTNKEYTKLNNQQRNIHLVSLKNGFCIGNLVKIGLRFVCSINAMKFNKQNIYHLLQKFIFKVYFQSNKNLQNNIYQKIVQSLGQYIKNALQIKINVQPQLSTLFLKIYQVFWQNQRLDINNTQLVSLLERHLTLLEFIHYNIPYHQDLINSLLFKSHLKSLFLFKGQNKASIHLLAINILEKTTKNRNQYLPVTQVFINLFNIMSCYGVHLIKDVWSSFYLLVESTEKSLFEPLELIQIILWKLQNHENTNVIKYCLHQLLQNPNSNRLFQKIPNIIYKNLIKMLNLGVHYLDCMFHMDSKSYSIIGSSFFLRYYTSQSLSQEGLKKHLEYLLTAIYELQNNDHALIALLMIFKNLQKDTKFLNFTWINNLIKLVTSAYVRYPIRKRYQMIDSILSLLLHHLDCESVGIQQVFQLLIQINNQYLIEPNISKFKPILKKYGEEQVKTIMNLMAQDILFDVKTNINFEKKSYDQTHLLTKIKIIQLYFIISDSRFSFYQQFFTDMISEYGQSLYKSHRQRCFLINAYYSMFSSLLKSMNKSKQFSKHLQSSLNLFAIFNDRQIIADENLNLENENINTKIVQMIQKLFSRAYRYNIGEQFSDREGERIVLARMMEWAFDHIHLNIGIQIIFAALRARIVVNRQKIYYKALYHNYQHLFEETLYQMYKQITDTTGKNNNKIYVLLKDKHLRLKVLLTTVLLTDSSHTLANNPPQVNEIGDVVDRYDFQKYEQVCWFIESIYYNCTKQSIIALCSENQLVLLVRQFDLLLENMVHNLGYSLEKKQILPLCQTVVNILFQVMNLIHKVSPCLIQMTIKLIKAGQNYLIFERAVVMCVIKGIELNFETIKQLECNELIPLFVTILSIQEYRGYDSAVYCYQQNMSIQIYQQFGMSLEENYNGTLPRFIFIFFLRKCFSETKVTIPSKFVDIIVNACLDIALAPVLKQKMFLSGKNKIKLQIWQFLLLFQPLILFQSMQAKIEQFLLRCIDLIGHNSISQIRYYSQIFTLRILMHPKLFRCITAKILDTIQIGLANSIGNVSKNVSYMVNSGLIIRHISSMAQKDYQHFSSIKSSFINLYNTLLTYICSSVAYFRGLSQYFCLQDIKGCLETKYVSILRENYLMDSDAITLKSRLNTIIESLTHQIEFWDIQVQVLSKTPNQNNNVVSRRYYMQILKKMSIELASITKNDDGFTAYRNIWKKNVASILNLKKQGHNDEDEIEPTTQQEEEIRDSEEINEEKEGTFQRKIDPTWDFIYNRDTGSHLKILVNSKSQVLMGHLARTGQIFGIQELIIPSKKMLELSSFKSISVTAERWLKISELSDDRKDNKSNQENLTRVLIKHRSEGYKIIKLSSNTEKEGITTTTADLKQPKCLLIIDEENSLSSDNFGQLDGQISIGKNLSLHVQASIFTWCYFKKYMKKE